MDINVTLFGEILTFAVLIWVTLKYIWPPIIKALNDRQQKIADGLAAAEKAHHDLDLTRQNIATQLRDVKAQATTIIDQANYQAVNLIEEGKAKTQTECEKLLAANKYNIEQEIIKARQLLSASTAAIALKAAEKILQRSVTIGDQQKLIDELIEEI